MGEPHRKRCKRLNVPGDAHYLTFSCFGRLPLLARDRSRQWLTDAIDQARLSHPFDLWAYVIMPEHVHVVLLPREGTQISRLLSAIKLPVSRRAVAWLQANQPEFLTPIEDVQPNGNRHLRFWQRGGGYDRNLRSVADIHEKIRYVHENPVRRGLVETPTDWPWSSARAWSFGEDAPLAIDRVSLPVLSEVNGARGKGIDY